MLDKFLRKDVHCHLSAYKRMCDIFHQTTFSEIRKETSKLRTYSLLKNKIGYEEYLSQIKNIKHRTILTKLRLSNHKLEIETGRYRRVNKNLRNCPFCPENVEDEMHFLLQCKTLKPLREKLFRDLETLNANFIHSTETNIFITLLTNPNYIHTTARYLDEIFQCRESLPQKHKKFT